MTAANPTIQELYAALEPDVLRLTHAFTTDIASAQDQVFAATDDAVRAEAIRHWLRRFQPCLFGRIAANLDLITFCFLTESDLQREDDYIQGRIQTARSEWTRLAFDGRKSAFILALCSPRLSNAAPNASLLALARRACELYLLTDIQPDNVYVDEVFLELPGPARRAWKWLAGVNVFASQADGRWWHDHRIPGGIAFSVNSVGHLAKASTIGQWLHALHDQLGIDDAVTTSPVSSLSKALDLAMRTIDGAAATEWGKATRLVPNSEVATDHPCPFQLPPFLADMNHCEYRGYYHTDITLPSEYFETRRLRPLELQERRLDFTYLFRRSVENPDHETMGLGRSIRLAEDRDDGIVAMTSLLDRHVGRTVPAEVALGDVPRLLAAVQDDEGNSTVS